MKRYLLTASCVVGWALAQAGCGEDFAPYNRIAGLRVLAIQSEPVAPAMGQTTTLTPLVLPPAGETVTYAWSWCPFAGPVSQGSPCAVPEAQLPMLLGPEAAAKLPSYNLGTDPTATFSNNIDPAVLQGLCSNKTPGATQVFNCTNGFPIQIKLVVTTPTDTVTTIRALDLAYDPLAPLNTNPVISGLTIQLLKRDVDRAPNVKGDQPERPAEPLDASGAALALRQRQMRLRVDVPLASSEPFIDTDKANQPVPANERLFLSWFAESGDTDNGQTGFLNGKTALEAALKNIWRPDSLKKYAPAQSKVVVVVRDNRGGVAWTWGVATLMEGAL